MTFRSAYRATVPMRLLDLAAHLALAWALPFGAAQFLPDLLLPGIWAHGMFTNRFLPRDHWALRVHRFLHLRSRWNVLAVVCVTIYAPWVTLHVLLHALIDLFTHTEEFR